MVLINSRVDTIAAVLRQRFEKSSNLGNLGGSNPSTSPKVDRFSCELRGKHFIRNQVSSQFCIKDCIVYNSEREIYYTRRYNMSEGCEQQKV